MKIRVWRIHSHPFSAGVAFILLQDCTVEAGKQRGRFGDQIWVVLCVIGGDSIEYLWGVLYYVMLHVLNQYNIQIVGVFSCMLSPGTYCVDMCDWCFYVCMWLFLIPQIDDQRRGGYVLCMYSAIVYNRDNLCWISVYYSIFLQYMYFS